MGAKAFSAMFNYSTAMFNVTTALSHSSICRHAAVFVVGLEVRRHARPGPAVDPDRQPAALADRRGAVQQQRVAEELAALRSAAMPSTAARRCLPTRSRSCAHGSARMFLTLDPTPTAGGGERGG